MYPNVINTTSLDTIQNSTFSTGASGGPTLGGTAGPEHPVGSIYVVGPQKDALHLFYVDSSDVLQEGSSAPWYDAESTDEQVTNPADSGAQVWIYVKNDSGSTISRGEPAVSAGPGTYSVAKAGNSVHPMLVIGVPQFDLPTGKAAWILKRGHGKVNAGAAIAIDTAFVPGATGGQIDAVAAVTDEAFGFTTAAAGAAGLVTAFIDCRG